MWAANLCDQERLPEQIKTSTVNCRFWSSISLDIFVIKQRENKLEKMIIIKQMNLKWFTEIVTTSYLQQLVSIQLKINATAGGRKTSQTGVSIMSMESGEWRHAVAGARWCWSLAACTGNAWCALHRLLPRVSRARGESRPLDSRPWMHGGCAIVCDASGNAPAWILEMSALPPPAPMPGASTTHTLHAPPS
jgi:hypothetical protein